MKTKSGKSHFIATLKQIMPDGSVKQIENYKFTANDPQKFAEQLPKRFSTAQWTAEFENLRNLDE